MFNTHLILKDLYLLYNRESLIPSQPSKKPGRVWGAPMEESDDTRSLSNDQMMTFQQRKMDGKGALMFHRLTSLEQDSVLDILSKSVGTIKEIAIGIGDETGMNVKRHHLTKRSTLGVN